MIGFSEIELTFSTVSVIPTAKQAKTEAKRTPLSTARVFRSWFIFLVMLGLALVLKAS
jgi:hypothetical protein